MSTFTAFANYLQQQQQQQQLMSILGSRQNTAVIVQQPIHPVVFVQRPLSTTYVEINATAVNVNAFTHTYIQPSLNSQIAGCIVHLGSVLTITGMTMDEQWFRLAASNTWIPRLWIR